MRAWLCTGYIQAASETVIEVSIRQQQKVPVVSTELRHQGVPVVRPHSFHHHGLGSIPGQGTGISTRQLARPKKTKKTKNPSSGVMSLEIRLISTRLGELTQEEKVERKEEGFPSKA